MDVIAKNSSVLLSSIRLTSTFLIKLDTRFVKDFVKCVLNKIC